MLDLSAEWRTTTHTGPLVTPNTRIPVVTIMKLMAMNIGVVAEAVVEALAEVFEEVEV